MNKTISVWLILKNEKEQERVVLQKRSLKDTSFSFICQSTWAGKVEPNEEVSDAVTRECREELGNAFCDNFNFSNLELINKTNFTNKKGDWETYNYMGQIDKKTLNLAKIHGEAFSEFVLVDKNSDFYPISLSKNPEINTVLFNDQYEVLKNILNKI